MARARRITGSADASSPRRTKWVRLGRGRRSSDAPKIADVKVTSTAL
jgi:hypothetical protein